MGRMRCKLAFIAVSLFAGSMMNAQSPTSAEVQEIAERAYSDFVFRLPRFVHNDTLDTYTKF